MEDFIINAQTVSAGESKQIVLNSYELHTKTKIEIPVFVQKIITVIGPRRSGKTFQLFNMMSTLLEQGVSLRSLQYL